MTTALINHAVLRWARERADRSVESLRVRFPKYELWERGEAAPTLKQLEAFAKATHVPVGYVFLPQPPEERIPIPDLRTVANRDLGHPSPNLLDTIYLSQQRQAALVWAAFRRAGAFRLSCGAAEVSGQTMRDRKETPGRGAGLDFDAGQAASRSCCRAETHDLLRGMASHHPMSLRRPVKSMRIGQICVDKCRRTPYSF